MSFDVDSFMNQEIDANFQSEWTPVPEGEWEAQIEEVKVRSYEVKKPDHPDFGQEKPILVLTWAIKDPEVAEETGLENPKVRQDVFLDFSNGVLLEGANKNIDLGKLQEIGDLKKDGFRLTDLVGVTAIVSVKHRMDEAGVPRAEVRRFTEAD